LPRIDSGEGKQEEDTVLNATMHNLSGKSNLTGDGQSNPSKLMGNHSNISNFNQTILGPSKLQAAFETSNYASSTNTKNAGLGIIDWACLFGVALLVAAFNPCIRSQPIIDSDEEPWLESNSPE